MTTPDDGLGSEFDPEAVDPELGEPHVGRRPDSLDAVERLVRANVESNDTMRDLVERVRHDSHMRERKIDLLEDGLRQTRQLLLMVGTAIVILVIVGLINATMIFQARRNAAVTAGVARDAQATYSLLLDCLNVTGECGKRNVAQTKAALDEIKKYELVVMYCARTNPQPVDQDGSKFVLCVDGMYPGGPELPSH